MIASQHEIPAPSGRKHNAVSLDQLILIDQLVAVRRSVLISMPVNMILGVLIVMVASNYGHAKEGMAWFIASSAINVIRIFLCRLPLPHIAAQDSLHDHQVLRQLVTRRLRLYWVSALASGIVWACLPLLSEAHTTPQTLFYIALMCGVTAGAVVHGSACARIPLAFITPVLLSLAGVLFYVGGFDRNCLGVAALLYLLSLSKSTLESQEQFRKTSELKNQATTLAESLRIAHAHSNKVAEEMRYRAAHDSLTGLLNRNGLMHEINQFSQTPNAPICMMLLDLDGFKSINDRYGHPTGDIVLVEVARRFNQVVDPKMCIARIGGDEFAILYSPHLVDEAPERLATRLIAALEVPFKELDASRLGVSIGIYHSSEADFTEMLTCADAALYVAKEAGRNRYHVFDEQLRAQASLRRDIERDLPQALASRQLQVWYQPIFSHGGKMVDNLEALIRWQHPKHGAISPPDVICAAATAGLAEELTHYILGEVCNMIGMLQERGLDHIRVALNMSPREMSQLAVDEFVLGTLQSRSLPAAMLEIEITEETALKIRDAGHKLANLSRAGVRIAIDDFGVGYSSLASLRELHVDRLKIDHCFIVNITHSADDQALVHAVLNLGASLGLEVVAEGVQTKEDLLMLGKLGCQIMQGNYLSRPMPADATWIWLDNHAIQTTA